MGPFGGVLLTAVRARDFRMALPLVVGRQGGDGRLAEPWLVRGGRGSLSPPAGIQPADSGAWRPQRLASQGRTSPSVVDR